MSYATVIAAVAAVAGAGVAYSNGQQQKKSAEDSINQAKANALKAEKQADQDSNKINQKKPDTSAILAAASQAGKGGVAGTMLTGPQGVDPNALSLGKSTLLGG